jgi:cytidine deaminase
MPRPLKMSELLPHAFGFDDLERVTGAAAGHQVPNDLAKWRGRGTVFVHPDLAGGETVWTAYWERSGGAADDTEKGVLEEGPNFPTTAQAVSWGLVRTPRIVVVDAEGGLTWAGETEPPDGIPNRWQQE